MPHANYVHFKQLGTSGYTWLPLLGIRASPGPTGPEFGLLKLLAPLVERLCQFLPMWCIMLDILSYALGTGSSLRVRACALSLSMVSKVCEMSVTKADFWLGSAASQASIRVPVQHVNRLGLHGLRHPVHLRHRMTVHCGNKCNMMHEIFVRQL